MNPSRGRAPTVVKFGTTLPLLGPDVERIMRKDRLTGQAPTTHHGGTHVESRSLSPVRDNR